MKKVYLIHGWGGSSKDNWFPWLKEELEKRKYRVIFPDMPDTFNPKIKSWVEKLINVIKNPDKDTYLIGHSIGCQTIMRYLETLPENIKIGEVIFVAGFFNLLNITKEEGVITKPWLETPIDFNKIKKHTKNFLAIFSNNDPYVPVSDAKIFKEKLGAKIVIEKNRGHFTEKIEPKILIKILRFFR